MRVLFISVPAAGHVFTLVPLAWAFRSAGHEVLVALAERPEWAAGAGLPVVDVAPGYSAVTIAQKVLEDDPGFAEAWFRSVGPDRDISPRAPMFAGFNRPLVAGTMEVVDQWRPDLVVYEQTTTVGAMAAARLGVPAVQRNLGPFTTGRTHQLTAGLLSDLCEEYGVPAIPRPAMILERLPPSMLHARPEGGFMGGHSYDGGGVLGGLWRQRPQRPRVVLSLGGGFSARFFGLGTLPPVIEAASKVDADFVLALGNVDTSALGTLPPNVRPADGWVPFGELFRTCSAVVHHGGANTVMSAVEAGIPQMVALDPQDVASEAIGQDVSDRGIGLTAPAEEITATMLERLLEDETLRTATAEVHTEVAGLPSPAAVAAELAGLVARL
ncbi:nucleotide disphospho-sugar-binding domain-containing protein [Actinomadura sp. NPDC049753]|uniref:nucleotide disphospho-sugar-binding domain-containing protein n=1 Tax=Actinomadura sp. NPDC049753 TaxID=3154739 RepID=UPI0034334E6A